MDVSQQSALFQDHLTGLTTIQGWMQGLPGGAFPAEGGLVLLHLAGFSGMTQTYGAQAGDTVINEIVARVRRALPVEATLLRGVNASLFAWLPGMTGIMGEAFASHLRQVACANPIALPSGEALQPRLISAAILVYARASVQEAVQTLERELVRQPEFAAPPTSMARVRSAREELGHRLEGMRLFGLDGMVEQVLSRLGLPALCPQTVIVLGPPQAGKTRMLASLRQLLGGQHLPMADTTCRPSESAVPFTLLVSIIHQFLTAYPPDMLQLRLGPICDANPWLAGLFPALQTKGTSAPQPPNDHQALRFALHATLMELARLTPHLALIHGLQFGDPQSLDTLAAMQATPGHGLRIIGGADTEDGGVPAALQALVAQQASVVPMPALTVERVQAYLQEALPDIAHPDVAGQLHRVTGGLPLAIEATLRAWAEDGLLTLDGTRWAFSTERVNEQADQALGAIDRERLAMAALTDAIPLERLAQLWRTSEEDARATVERGRHLGLLRPPDPEAPQIVSFTDRDYAAGLTEQLTPSQRRTIHSQIGAQLEATAGQDMRHAPELAYHFTQAGDVERAQHYRDVLELALPTLIPTLADLRSAPVEGIERWDIPPAMAVAPDEIDKLIEVAQTVRLVGVQLRLYPENSDIVRQAVLAALRALDQLLTDRPSLIITYDGRSVAFDGQILRRRDVQVAVNDFESWMSEGSLWAIGFARGVHAQELTRFMATLGTYQLSENDTPLIDVMTGLKLPNIKVLSRPFQQDMSYGAGVQPPASSPAGPVGGGGGGSAMPPLPPVPPISGGADTVMQELDSLLSGSPVPAAVESGGFSSSPTLAELAPMGMFPGGAMPAVETQDFTLLDQQRWQALPLKVEQSPAQHRRLLMIHLAKWLRERPGTRVPGGVNVLLIQRLQREMDPTVLQETTVVVEHQLVGLIRHIDWEGLADLLTALTDRASREREPETKRIFEAILENIGGSESLRNLVEETVARTGKQDVARQVVGLLGPYAVKPIINELKNAAVLQERSRLVQLLGRLGGDQVPLLLRELREQNPWYVYRNILQVVAQIGGEQTEENGDSALMDALGTVSEKIRHADPRVRAEALNAAVRIARENAAPYLLQGLEDEDPTVRTRAASLAGVYPNGRLLDPLLRLVTGQGIADKGTDGVRLAACMSLGRYQQTAAREALLRIVRPGLLSRLLGRGDEIRAAATSALGNHMTDPQVQQAVRDALNDRDTQVRQAAQRIWREHTARLDTGTGA